MGVHVCVRERGSGRRIKRGVLYTGQCRIHDVLHTTTKHALYGYPKESMSYLLESCRHTQTQGGTMFKHKVKKIVDVPLSVLIEHKRGIQYLQEKIQEIYQKQTPKGNILHASVNQGHLFCFPSPFQFTVWKG